MAAGVAQAATPTAPGRRRPGTARSSRIAPPLPSLLLRRSIVTVVCLAARARIASSVRRWLPRASSGRAGRKAIEMTRKSVWALLLGFAVVAGGCQKKGARPRRARRRPGGEATGQDEKAASPWGRDRPAGRAVGEGPQPEPGRAGGPEEGPGRPRLAGEKPQYDIQQYGPALQERAEAQAGAAAAGEKAKSAVFRDAAAAEAGAVKTASGLVSRRSSPAAGRARRPPTPCASTTTAPAGREGLRQLRPARRARPSSRSTR